MSDVDIQVIQARARGACELCGGAEGLAVFPVEPVRGATDGAWACEGCRDQLAPGATLDSKRWFCLQEAAWSPEPAIQALSWRILGRLSGEGWATELLESLYLEEDVLAWAQAESDAVEGHATTAPTLDSNGAELSEGDTVSLIKDLDVKGTSFVAKRGTLVRGIHLVSGDPDNIEGRINKVSLVLKTCFLKRVS